MNLILPLKYFKACGNLSIMKKGIYVLLLFILMSCSRNEPRINSIFHQFNLQQNTELNKIEKKLSLFVQVQDEDGLSDIDSIYILNDQNDFFWTLKSDQWFMTQREGQDWIGSNSLVFPDNYDFSARNFRILCEDLSGAYAESSFTLSLPENINPSLVYPSVKFDSNSIKVISPVAEPMLWTYDLENNFVAYFPVPREGVNINTITSRKSSLREGFDYTLYYYSDEFKIGVLSGPYHFEANP